MCAEPVGGKKSGRLPAGDRKDFRHSGVRLRVYGSGSLGNLRGSVYGDEVHADLCHSCDRNCCCSLFCHADIDAGHHGAGASQLPEGISVSEGSEEVPIIEIMRSDDSYDALGEETVKRISTERSLPHDNVIVGGRFLRTWGVDIRSMLIKPRGDRESGAQRGKEAD